MQQGLVQLAPQALNRSEQKPLAGFHAAQLPPAAHSEHLTSRCQGWTDDMTRSQGWAPEVA